MSRTILSLTFCPHFAENVLSLAFVGTAFLGRPSRFSAGLCGGRMRFPGASSLKRGDLPPLCDLSVASRRPAVGVVGWLPVSPLHGSLGDGLLLVLSSSSLKLKRKTANCELLFSLPRVIISGRSTPTQHACLDSLVLRHCHYDSRPGPSHMGVGSLGEG